MKLKKVYVFEGENKCKIGISRLPATRLANIKGHNSEKLNLVFESTPRADAQIIERISHIMLENSRIRYEWFLISTKLAIETVHKAIEIVDNNKSDEFFKKFVSEPVSKYKRIIFVINLEEQRALLSTRASMEKKYNKRLSISETVRLLLRQHSEQTT